MNSNRCNVAKLVNKLSVIQIAELINLTKSYVSQVKHGKRPPSQRLLESLIKQTRLERPERDYFQLFLKSREAMGVSPKTLVFYKDRLSRFV